MKPINDKREPDAVTVLHLEAGLEGDRVRICLASRQSGEVQTMSQVEDLSVGTGRIARRCRDMVHYLNQANRQGRLAPDVLARLQETGQLFRDDLFSATIKERLNAGAGNTLVLAIDDALAHIPWELLHDGSQFLGQRFAMGRIVRTRQPVAPAPARRLAPPLRMLVLADPGGDLKAAYDEGIAIRDQSELHPRLLHVSFRSTGVRPEFVKAKLRGFDLVHFAGHADFDEQNGANSGWRLSRGRLTARDIRAMSGTGSMPALVFANACQSARSRIHPYQDDLRARRFDLANAFLMSGVRHYLGTFWDIPDEPGRVFALGFYRSLLGGEPIGEAVQAARREIIERFGEASIVWAGYLLYGDPAGVYFPPAPGVAHQEASAPAAHARLPAAATGRKRSPEDILHLDAGSRRKRFGKRVRVFAAAVAVMMLGIFGWWLASAFRSGGSYEQQALAAFRDGRYEMVREACLDLQREHPQRSLGYLLLANVLFHDGDLEQARALYEQAAGASRGSDLEKAEAYIGLGRIASLRGDIDSALSFYEKAARLAPADDGPLVAQALLLEQAGQSRQAVALLHKARSVASDTQTLDALIAQIQSTAALEADRQRRAHIDRLIRDLTTRLQADPDLSAKVPPPDENRPLTVWIADIETVGYSLREGTATLLASGLMDRLLQTGRIQLVERSLLHGLMDELHLGSSRLADPSTRLQLGRLTAAHILVAGRVVYTGAHLQVTLRCVETDSGQIFAVVNGRFAQQEAIFNMVNRLAAELIARIQERYPGRVGVVK